MVQTLLHGLKKKSKSVVSSKSNKRVRLVLALFVVLSVLFSFFPNISAVQKPNVQKLVAYFVLKSDGTAKVKLDLQIKETESRKTLMLGPFMSGYSNLTSTIYKGPLGENFELDKSLETVSVSTSRNGEYDNFNYAKSSKKWG